MRIAFVTNNFEPIISGITTSINGLIEGLKIAGHTIYVFAPYYPGYRDTDAKIFRTRSLPIYYKEKYPIPLETAQSMAKIMEHLSIDIIHSHHPFGLGRVAQSVAKKYLQIPLFFTYHTLYEEYCHYIPLPQGNYLRRYIKYKAIEYSNACDYVIVPSNGIRKLLIQSGCSSKVVTVPSGTTLSLFSNDSSRSEALRTKYNIKEDEYVLLLVSRLAKEKNCEFVLRTFSILLKELPKAKLLIVGDGPDMNKLNVKTNALGLSDAVIFTGSIPHTEVAGFYMISDLLLFVSQTDTQGLPLIEALSFGLPVVATRSLATEYFVKNLQTGIVTEPSIDSFCNAINCLYKSRSLVSEFALRNKIVSNQFRSQKLATKLASIYSVAH